jgi:type I restriction enzyme M protein
MPKADLTELNGEQLGDAVAPDLTAHRGRRTSAKANGATSKLGLSAVIKSVRDKLRKDAGLSGETDRLPQLAWMLFLKFLDDSEQTREYVHGDHFVPIIDAPFRWRDWAAHGKQPDALKGDELIQFVNNDLMGYLRTLSGVDQSDIRTKIGEIFRGTDNRIRSGYILREVVDQLSTINFNSSDDIHLVSHFYESMLKEMRDAAGDSGEFYTPRPVVRLIIDRLAPRLGELVLDPACGTGGFLVETWERLKDQATTPEQRAQLQRDLQGIEKKAMPYLLGMVNMLLHGVDAPNVSERNALQTNITRITDDQRVDVVATNPPFGGEEETGILSNFPEGMRTQETAILFFQFVIETLRAPGGRCGIVLPNGFLFGGGIAAAVKKELLERFNLHTIVRLPNGVFSPYTSIPTNLLFFEACDHDMTSPCTHEVWYYEHPLPHGRKSYTKTLPLQFEEFGTLRTWWEQRLENEHAWRVPVERIIESGYNLDIVNPRTAAGLQHMPPGQLVQSIIAKEQRILDLIAEIGEELTSKT